MDDEDWARATLLEAGTEPGPPSTVDPRRAIVTGRRRRRIRGVAAAAIAGIAVFAAVVVPAALAGDGSRTPGTAAESPTLTSPPVPTGCAPTPLPMPAGVRDGRVTNGDPTGRYLVGVLADQSRGALWTDGKVEEIRPPGGGKVTHVVVNSSGVVALTSLHGEEQSRQWIRRNGTYTELAVPAGRYRVAGINARGDVIGDWIWSGGATAGDVRPPLLWQAGEQQPRELAGGVGVVAAQDIDDDGTVVGYSTDWVDPDASHAKEKLGKPTTPSTPTRMEALYWTPDGKVHQLPLLAGHGPTSRADLIRDGMVVGRMMTGTGRERGETVAVWHLPSGRVTTVAGMWYASDVNQHGWMVGRTSGFTAGVYFGAEVTQLPLPPNSDYDASSLSTISDDGRTVGGESGSTETGNKSVPVRWNCK